MENIYRLLTQISISNINKYEHLVNPLVADRSSLIDVYEHLAKTSLVY